MTKPSSRSVAIVLVGFLSVGRFAAAQDAADLARRELVAQAERARGRGDHALALELASRAGALRWTPSLRLLAAQEHQDLGHPVEALGLASACAREAELDANIHNHDQVLASCREVVAAMEQLVGRIRIHVTEHPAGLRVRVANAYVPDALLDVPYPVTPGELVVTATAPDRVPVERRVTVTAGAVVDATLALEPIVTPPVGAAPMTSPIPVRQPRGPGVGPWVVTGAGVLALAAGVILAETWLQAKSSDYSGCAMVCSTTQYQGPTNQYRAALWGTGSTLVVGGAAVAGGLLWYLLFPRSHTTATALRWMVSPVAGGSIAVGEGSF